METFGRLRAQAWPARIRRSLSASRLHDEAGQILVLAAAAMVLLIGLAGLSLDVGNLVANKSEAQGDADAAALAAAGRLADGGSHAQALSEAKAYVKAADTIITVNHPPLTGTLAGDTNAVEVVVQRDLPKYLIGVLYKGSWKASARAVARIEPAESGFGVVALDPHKCQSLLMDSNAKLKVTGGGVFVNSDCATAFQTNSNNTAQAERFSITGGWKNGGSMPAPSPKTNQPPIEDPWADIPTPPMPANAVSTSCSGSGNKTLTPGVITCAPYKIEAGTLTLSGPAGSTFVFRGGLEVSSDSKLVIPNKAIVIFDGGGMLLGSAVTVTASNGVLFYNKCNGACTTKDRVYITSNSVVNVKPYGAPYDNIVFYQQRTNTRQMYFDAGVTLNTQGGVYAKTAEVYVDSNCNTPIQFAVGSIKIGAGANINVNVGNLKKVKTPPTAFLAE